VNLFDFSLSYRPPQGSLVHFVTRQTVNIPRYYRIGTAGVDFAHHLSEKRTTRFFGSPLFFVDLYDLDLLSFGS
jgi:hypothetical protein